MRISASLIVSACLLLANPHFALAQTASPPMGATQGPTPSTQAAAPTNEPSPFTLKLMYTGELWDNVEGGIKDTNLYVQNLDAQFAVDTEKAFGWTGGRFLLDAFYNNSRSPDTQLVNPIQDPSVVDTASHSFIRLYQMYYDQNLGNTDLLAGIYDVQTEFANTNPMEIFFNGAYAWNTALDQSGFDGPSTYPDTALGTRIRQKIDDQWSVQAAVTDGAADNPANPVANDIILSQRYGAFAIGEVDYTPIARTKIMAGYWDYTGRFDALSETNHGGMPTQIWGSDGGYIGGATRLYTQQGKRGLDGFLNLGFADPTVNETDRTVNGGLTYTGLFDARPNDKFGVAFSVAGVSEPYKKSQIAAGDGVYDAETNFEVTYRAPITDWLTLQPDIQYWIHPGVDPTNKNDLIVGFHFEIGHLFNL